MRRTTALRGTGSIGVSSLTGSASALELLLRDNERKSPLGPDIFLLVEGILATFAVAGLGDDLSGTAGVADSSGVAVCICERSTMPCATSISFSCSSLRPTARPALMNLATAGSCIGEYVRRVGGGTTGGWSAGGIASEDGAAASSGSCALSSLRPRLIFPMTCRKPLVGSAFVDCDRATGAFSWRGNRKALRSGEVTPGSAEVYVAGAASGADQGSGGLEALSAIGSSSLDGCGVEEVGGV